MRIIKKNIKDGEVRFKVTNVDDLWYLSHIIEKGDLVRGIATRKVKIGDKEKSVKKTYFLGVEVEKTEFSHNNLRVLGVIREGPDDIEMGSYQSIVLETGSDITIIKKKWLQHQLKRLDEATQERSKIMICCIERDKACFAMLKPQGYSVLSSLKGEVQKKGYETEAKDFFADVLRRLNELDLRHDFDKIIIGSPGFWKQEIRKRLDNRLKSKSLFVISTGGDERAIGEVLKSDELHRLLSKERVAHELALVEQLLTAIAKDADVAYGIDEVEECAQAGAVKILLVTDRFLFEQKEAGRFNEVDRIMNLTEKSKGEVHIISSEHEGGKKLQGLGSIAAILRYKIK